MIGYVYGLYASDKEGACRYIGITGLNGTGKTSEDRLAEHIRKSKKNHSARDKWIQSVISRGAAVVVVTLESCEASNPEDLDNALKAAEKTWIANGRSEGWALLNGTDGGDGTAGFAHSDEAKAKIAAAQLGTKKSPETIEKMRAAHLGARRSEESRARMSRAQTGKKMSVESRQKMSLARMGNSHNVGRRLSPEHKAAISRGVQEANRRKGEGVIDA